MSGPIYMERNKSFKDTFLFFELESCRLFKTIFCLKHLPSIASYYSQNILSFTKFSRKRKYYREFIFYKQCKLARIISKDGWVIIFWGQHAETICLTISDIP